MLASRCRYVTLEIYGRSEEACLADQVARVHTAPDRSRVVAAEALQGGRGQEAFYSTCSDATTEPSDCLVRRALEHRSQQSAPGLRRNRRAVERTAPLAMPLYSLIVLWFAREGHRQWRPLEYPWYTPKAAPSFADMLGALRRLSTRQQVLT